MNPLAVVPWIGQSQKPLSYWPWKVGLPSLTQATAISRLFGSSRLGLGHGAGPLGVGAVLALAMQAHNDRAEARRPRPAPRAVRCAGHARRGASA